MACRHSTALALEVLPRRNAQLAATRLFSSGRSSSAPPRAPPKAAPGKPKISPYARNKGASADEEGGAGGQGLGNVLEQVTLPPPDLSSLALFHPETVTEAAVGEVKAFSPSTLAAFKAFTLPKPIQDQFSSTTRPATVIRTATLEAAAVLDASKKGPSRASRHVLTGPSGSGKSVLLLQAASYAHSTDWIVLYLPSTKPLVDSSTPHSYSAAQAIFHQPDLSTQLLTRFASANKATFKTLTTRKEWTFGERKVAAGKSLDELATKGVEAKTASDVLEALFDELAHQKSHPVLLAIDDAQPLFNTSNYVDPSYNAVEAFSLSIPRLLLDFISGARTFESGSILIAPSLLSAHSSPAVTDFLTSQSSDSLATPSPYASLGSSFDVYRSILSGLEKLEVSPRLERKEAIGVVEMLRARRGVREPMSDQSFLERYVAADGNPREFSRGLEHNTQL